MPKAWLKGHRADAAHMVRVYGVYGGYTRFNAAPLIRLKKAPRQMAQRNMGEYRPQALGNRLQELTVRVGNGQMSRPAGEIECAQGSSSLALPKTGGTLPRPPQSGVISALADLPGLDQFEIAEDVSVVWFGLKRGLKILTRLLSISHKEIVVS